MKQTDIAMLILIVSITLLISYFLGNALLVGDTARSTEVETVEAISSEFAQPDEDIFNEDAINLTQTIIIGETESTDPFTSGE